LVAFLMCILAEKSHRRRSGRRTDVRLNIFNCATNLNKQVPIAGKPKLILHFEGLEQPPTVSL
jgi:hypothetical protein